MKSHPSTRRNGFTLIELLVVISIIALLASLAIPTANIVMRKAKETQARAAVQGIVIAVKGYQTEYNRLPNPETKTNDASYDTKSDNDMIKILVGKQTTYNPREVVFYDPPVAKNEANGLITDGSTVFEVVDPWSNPTQHLNFHMTFDYDGDHSIDNPVKTATPTSGGSFNTAYVTAEPDKLPADVVVYSDNDPKAGTNMRKPITSW